MKRLLLMIGVCGLTLAGCVTGSVASRPISDDDYAPPPPDYTPPRPPQGPAGGYAEQPVVDEGVAYYGAHPIPDAEGGGWCIIDGPHIHPYEPEWYDQYTFQDNYFYFGLGYSDWLYADRHPVPPDEGGGWCGISGPHHHGYRPWAGYRYDGPSHVYFYEPERERTVAGTVVRPSRQYRAPPRVTRRVPGNNVAHAPAGNVAHQASPRPDPVRAQPAPVPVPVARPPERTYYPQPARAAEQPHYQQPTPQPTPRPTPVYAPQPAPAPVPRPVSEPQRYRPEPRPEPARPMPVQAPPPRVERPSPPPHYAPAPQPRPSPAPVAMPIARPAPVVARPTVAQPAPAPMKKKFEKKKD